MEIVWEAMMSMPTGVYTIGMMFVAMYWILVVIGACDIDLIPLEGGELDMDVGIDTDADIDAHHISHGFLGNSLMHVGVGTVPITLVVSALIITGWIIGLTAEVVIWPILSFAMPGWAFGLIEGVAMFFGSIQTTALCVAPLKRALKVERIHGQEYLIGKSVEIVSSQVSDKIGTASLRHDNLDLVLNVRVDVETFVKKGDQAIIVDYDKEKNIYKIKPVDLI